MHLTDLSTQCLLLLAAIVVLLMFRTRGKIEQQRRQSAAEENKAGVAGSGAGRNAVQTDRPLPGDLAEWEVHMHETARRLSAELDAKLGLLEALTAEADRAAERLEVALAQDHPALPPESQADSLRPADEECDAGPAEAQVDDDDEIKRHTAEQDPAEAKERSRRREEIYQLADYGFAAAEIARRVGSPVGEVELILSLRQS